MRRPRRPVPRGGEDAPSGVVRLVSPKRRLGRIPCARRRAREFSASIPASPAKSPSPPFTSPNLCCPPSLPVPKLVVRHRQIRLPESAPEPAVRKSACQSIVLVEMSTPAGGRKPNRASDVAAAAQARTNGRGVGAATTAGMPFGRGRGVGLAPPPRSRERGGEPVAAATQPFSIDGCIEGGFPSSSPWFESAGDSFSPTSWDQDARPPGGFMSYFGNQGQNSHLVGSAIYNNASSPPEVEIRDGNDNTRTEKRIMWTMEEDIRVMSAWIQHSTNSSCGADKSGQQYWGDVVEEYNKTTPPLRRRNLKQCKDRWHKINRWTQLFECAYVKARRTFTSVYSDQMWIDAAHKFYVDDNKDANLGPFVLMEVWKICRDEPKWKTYNEDMKNARKRRSFHLEGDSQEEDATPDVPLKRPIGQKAAKKAALAANGKLKGDDGHSKESPIELHKFDRYSKFQEENNEKRMKILDRQDKLSSEKLEATKIAHLTAQEYKEGKKIEKESKMMETYNNLISQDTSLMSNEEKAHRVAMMKCLMKALFPETTD